MIKDELGEFFTDLYEAVHRHCRALNIDDVRANDIAFNTALELSDLYSSRSIYVTRDIKSVAKHISIYRSMKMGVSPKLIANEHNVSVAHVYAVYRKEKKKRENHAQKPKQLSLDI